MLHAGNRIKILGLGVDGSGNLAVVPFALCPRDNALHLLKVEGTSVAVVALFHRHRAAIKQRLALHALGQNLRELAQTAAQWGRDLFKWGKRQWFLVDGVAAKELVCALAGKNYLDVFAGLLRHKVQRDQRGVSHWIVQVPHDLRDGLGIFFRRNNLDDVLHTNSFRGLCRDIDLRIALALEAGGKGQ